MHLRQFSRGWKTGLRCVILEDRYKSNEYAQFWNSVFSSSFLIFLFQGSGCFFSCKLSAPDRGIQAAAVIFSLFLHLKFLCDQSFQNILKFQNFFIFHVLSRSISPCIFPYIFSGISHGISWFISQLPFFLFIIQKLYFMICTARRCLGNLRDYLFDCPQCQSSFLQFFYIFSDYSNPRK